MNKSIHEDGMLYELHENGVFTATYCNKNGEIITDRSGGCQTGSFDPKAEWLSDRVKLFFKDAQNRVE